MTTEKTGQQKEGEENCAAMNCCSPHKFLEMMAKCGDDTKGDWSAMMQGMMKGGCCPTEEK